MEIQKAQRTLKTIQTISSSLYSHFMELTSLTLITDKKTEKVHFMQHTVDVAANNAFGCYEEMIGDLAKLDAVLNEFNNQFGPDASPPIPAGWKRICEEKPALDQWIVLWSPHFVKPETRQFTQANAAFNWDSYTDHIWSPVPDIPIIYAGA